MWQKMETPTKGVSSTAKVYLLGPAGTYDISDPTNYYYSPRYKDFTEENFIIVSGPKNSTDIGHTAGSATSWIRAGLKTPTITYDATTGILVFNKGWVRAAVDGGGSVQPALDGLVYLVDGGILSE